MSEAFIITCWKNSSISTDGYTIGDRISTGHKLPTFASLQESFLSSSNLTQSIVPPAWTSLSVTLSRPINSTQTRSLMDPKSLFFIYAYSDRPVERIDDPASSFKRHDDYAEAFQVSSH